MPSLWLVACSTGEIEGNYLKFRDDEDITKLSVKASDPFQFLSKILSNDRVSDDKRIIGYISLGIGYPFCKMVGSYLHLCCGDVSITKKRTQIYPI